ncbi:hypothetical protein GT037_001752, partial [Alternaria burnsii]
APIVGDVCVAWEHKASRRLSETGPVARVRLPAVEVSSTTEYGGDGRASREGTQESVHRVGAPFIISRWTSTRH